MKKKIPLKRWQINIRQLLKISARNINASKSYDKMNTAAGLKAPHPAWDRVNQLDSWRVSKSVRNRTNSVNFGYKLFSG